MSSNFADSVRILKNIFQAKEEEQEGIPCKIQNILEDETKLKLDGICLILNFFFLYNYRLSRAIFQLCIYSKSWGAKTNSSGKRKEEKSLRSARFMS